ncbi:hypothetical protein J1N35_011614 [Gossypium stocksii]|uniref:Uncharacterized protein n=1 Tax=Gossypium stocksii TaxID=47602 RepID=A0A9D3W2M8_9ROSI|nr:hypothetical protein J1N35_011614 [Gossypium stocksii]
MGKKGASDKVMAKVPSKFERVASAPKFKQRKVSAIRDFPPGCDRIIVPNSRSSELITVDQSSQAFGDREFLALYVIRCVTVYSISVDRYKPIKCVSNLVLVNRLRS